MISSNFASSAHGANTSLLSIHQAPVWFALDHSAKECATILLRRCLNPLRLLDQASSVLPRGDGNHHDDRTRREQLEILVLRTGLVRKAKAQHLSSTWHLRPSSSPHEDMGCANQHKKSYHRAFQSIHTKVKAGYEPPVMDEFTSSHYPPRTIARHESFRDEAKHLTLCAAQRLHVCRRAASGSQNPKARLIDMSRIG